jgi:hypothetical protein
MQIAGLSPASTEVAASRFCARRIWHDGPDGAEIALDGDSAP